MKNKILIAILVFIVGLVSIIFIMFNSRESEPTKIVIETNEKYMTMHNDGGTCYETRYEIDLKDRKVIKYGSYYIGFKGYEYKDKIVYEKELTNSEFIKFNKIIDDIILNKDTYSVDSQNTYMPYVFTQGDIEIKIYDSVVISNLEEVLKNND